MSRQSKTGKLHKTTIKTAKPREKAYKLSDGAGLYILVTPQGAKYWRLKYRINGKEKTLALGVWPGVSVEEARVATDKSREWLRQGHDPYMKRQQEFAEQMKADNTFRHIALEWHDKQKGAWTENHAERVLGTLENDVFPIIGDMPIKDIQTLDCLRAVRLVEERGALDVASRVKQRISSVFRYAIQTARCETNPADQLQGVIQTRKVTHRAALSADALPSFLRKLDNYPGYPLTKLGLELLVLTFVRPGELRGARWDEFDLDKQEWRIPAARMKMNEEHIVPLSDQAIRVLTKLKTMTGQYALAFPGVRNTSKPMSENTLGFAIQRRLGFNATAHGFRATASTILNETGFRPDVIERQLAHAERKKVRAAYNRAQYLEERREMMQWWGDYIDDQRTAQKVVPIRSAK